MIKRTFTALLAVMLVLSLASASAINMDDIVPISLQNFTLTRNTDETFKLNLNDYELKEGECWTWVVCTRQPDNRFNQLWSVCANAVSGKLRIDDLTLDDYLPNLTKGSYQIGSATETPVTLPANSRYLIVARTAPAFSPNRFADMQYMVIKVGGASDLDLMIPGGTTRKNNEFTKKSQSPLPTPGPVPKTGDAGTPVLWGALLMLTASVFVRAAFRRKQSRR